MKNDGKQTPESSSASEQPVEGKVIPPKGNDQGNGSAPRV